MQWTQSQYKQESSNIFWYAENNTEFYTLYYFVPWTVFNIPIQYMKDAGDKINLDKGTSKTVNRTIYNESWQCTWVFCNIIQQMQHDLLTWAYSLNNTSYGGFWKPLGYHMYFSSFNDFAVLSIISMRHCWENNSIYYLSQFSCCCI